MTTIAVDVENKVVAADTKVSGGCNFFASKILTTPRGEIISTSGDLSACNKFEDWIRRGRGRKKPTFTDAEAFVGVVVDQNGVFMWDNSLVPTKLIGKYWALGSGGSYALAAMHCGKTPVEAVELACKLDNDSGGEVQSMAYSRPSTRRIKR